jgi:flagellar protein FliS
MDIGGKPAQTLSEFYASTFAQILQASQSASRPKFEHAIACVRNVRDAWKQVAVDADLSDQQPENSIQSGSTSRLGVESGMDTANAARWTA